MSVFAQQCNISCMCIKQVGKLELELKGLKREPLRYKCDIFDNIYKTLIALFQNLKV